MRKRAKDVFALLLGLAAVVGFLQVGWIIWGDYFRALYFATRLITGESIATAGVVGAIAFIVMHFVKKRSTLTKVSFYDLLAERTSGKIQLAARAMAKMFSGDDRKAHFISLLVFHIGDHPFVDRVRGWVVRILSVLFWPLITVGMTSLAEKDLRTSGGYALTVLVMTLIFMLCGVRLGNLLLFVLLASWLSFIIITQDGVEGLRHAAVIGFGLMLWGIWQQWSQRITEPPQDEPPAPKPEAA
jgi:hypothetical protein